MRERSKKSLSVLLSVVLAMSCFSVLFAITPSALTADEAKAELLAAFEAIPPGELDAYAFTPAAQGGHSSSSGTMPMSIVDNTSNGSIYDAAVAFADYLATDAMKLGTGTLAADENTNYWWTKVRKILVEDTTYDFTPYQTLIALFCNMLTESKAIRTDNFTRDRGNPSSTTNVNSYYNLVVTVTRSEISALRAYDSVTNFPASVGTSFSYGMNGTRVGSSSTRYYRFASVRASSETKTSALADKIKAYKNYFTDDVLNTNLYAIDEQDFGIIVANVAALRNNLSGLSTADIAKYVPNNAAILQFILDCDYANTYRTYKPDVEYFTNAGGFLATVEGDLYDTDDLVAMQALWDAADVHYQRLLATTADQKAVLVAELGLDLDRIAAARVTLNYDIKFKQLTVLKAEVDALYDLYHNAEEDYSALDDVALQGLIDSLVAYNNAINAFAADVIDAVFPDGKAYIPNFIIELKYEAYLREYTLTADEFKGYFTDLLLEDFSGVATADIIAKIGEAEAKYEDYKIVDAEVSANMRAEDYDAIYADFYLTIEDSIDRMYRLLNTRLEEQVATAVTLYGGLDVGAVTWQNFVDVKAAVDGVEQAIYDFLDGTDYMSADLIAAYVQLKTDILAEYAEFVKDGGYDNFVQTELDSTYPVRNALVTDIARALGENYAVTEEAILTVLESLENLLLSETFTDLTDIDISGCIGGMSSCLCSDSMVNDVLSILYPTILDAFEDVWSDLPEHYVDGDINAYLTIVPLYDVLADMGAGNTLNNLAIYPDLLAKGIDGDKFPEAKAALASATLSVKNQYPSAIWEDDRIADEDGCLTLEWGIDEIEDPVERSEHFRDALAQGLSGMYPLLASLFLGQTYEGHHNKVAEMTSGSYSGIAIRAPVIFLDLEVTQGSEGYASVLTPIYEALLGTDIPDGIIPTIDELHSYTNAHQLVDAIVNPLTAFINGLADAPLTTIVELLPNLGYAFSLDNIMPLFNKLLLDVVYTPDGMIEYRPVSSWCTCRMLSEFTSSLSGAVSLDVGKELMKTDSLDTSFLTDFNGLLDMVSGCISSKDDKLVLPKINSGCLATLGEMLHDVDTVRYGGERHYIEADKADVFLSLLRYLLNSLKTSPELLDSIIGMFGDDDDEEGCTILDSVLPILEDATADVDNTIAALVELVCPAPAGTYSMMEYEWLVPNGDETSPILVDYSEYWTAQQSKYVGENLEEYLSNLLQLFGITDKDTKKAYDINGLLKSVIGETFYTTSILETIAGLIPDLLESLDESIMDIINDVLGIDLASFAVYAQEDYDWGFEDGDKAGFTAALSGMLSPLSPILAFLLTEQADFSVLSLVNASGYNGYAYGIIPILEAFGAEGILTQSEFDAAVAADPSALLTSILNPLFGVIDELYANPLDTIVEKLPAILYFLTTGGLTVAVNNAAHSIFVVLDTIRPIYSVDFSLNLDTTSIFNMLIGLLNDSFDVEFTIPVEALHSLMMGTIVPYDSKSGLEAYTMEANAGDLYTAIARLLVGFIMHRDNIDALLDVIAEATGIPADLLAILADALYSTAENYVDGDNDKVLALIYTMFIETKEILKTIVTAQDLITLAWTGMLDALSNSGIPFFEDIADSIKDFFNENFEGILDEDGFFSGGLVGFFNKIVEFFQKIIDFFTNLFGG